MYVGALYILLIVKSWLIRRECHSKTGFACAGIQASLIPPLRDVPSGEERSPSFYLNSFHFKAFTGSPFLNWLSLAAIKTVNFHRQCLRFALQK